MLPLDFSGLFGIWLMGVIAILFAVIFLGTSIFALFYHKYGAKTGIKRGVLQLMFSSLAILLIDILVTYLLISDQNSGQYFKGEELDQFALYIWLPVHIIGIILLVFLIWYFNRDKRIKKAA